jgi:hypothetical protein
MQPTQELIDDIYREKVERAREASMAEKFFDGLFLFDHACEWAKAGLRNRFPQDNEEQIQQRLLAQLALLKSLEPQAWTTIPTSEASSML